MTGAANVLEPIPIIRRIKAMRSWAHASALRGRLAVAVLMLGLIAYCLAVCVGIAFGVERLLGSYVAHVLSGRP